MARFDQSLSYILKKKNPSPLWRHPEVNPFFREALAQNDGPVIIFKNFLRYLMEFILDSRNRSPCYNPMSGSRAETLVYWK